jgi:hypothetical protein
MLSGLACWNRADLEVGCVVLNVKAKTSRLVIRIMACGSVATAFLASCLSWMASDPSLADADTSDLFFRQPGLLVAPLCLRLCLCAWQLQLYLWVSALQYHMTLNQHISRRSWQLMNPLSIMHRSG